MSEPKRIAIYGGSFDPPHKGHRNLVIDLLKNHPEINKICIVPNRISPFKREKYFSPTECLQLTELNFLDLDLNKIEILPNEILKNDISYTYETILEVKSIYPGYLIDLILGDDQLDDLLKWKNIEIIFKEVTRFLIYRRKYPKNQSIPIPDGLFGIHFDIQQNDIWKESSSSWRLNPSKDSIYSKVLSAMHELVERKYNSSSLFYWKKLVEGEITKTRLEHSVRVSQIARKMAESMNYLFPVKAELAGIVHDITKQKSNEFHIELFKKHNFFEYVKLPMQAYHAYSAKYYLYELGLQDWDILEAVSHHTLGNVNYSMLDGILYASDFLGSDFFHNQSKSNLILEKCLSFLEEGILLKSQSTLRELLNLEKEIHNNTIYMYNQSIQIRSKELNEKT
jgi:nicotinate (nicotinamide) nucleotide adenylyltransferase